MKAVLSASNTIPLSRAHLSAWRAVAHIFCHTRSCHPSVVSVDEADGAFALADAALHEVRIVEDSENRREW
jgi:hypothetical protein